MTPDLLFMTLWLVAALLFFSMCIPPLFHLLGLSRYYLETEETAGEPEPGDDDPYTAKLLRQLDELGMKPLGVLTESVHFFAFHWTWSCRQRVWGSKERQAFAVLYRFVEGEPMRQAFATGFDDGAMVWTGNHSEDIRLMAPNFVRWGKATDDLTELLELHHRAAEHLGGGDRRPTAHDHLDELARVLEPHSRNFIVTDKSVPLAILGMVLIGGGALPLSLAWGFGFDSWLVPAALIVEGIFYWGLHTRALIRNIAQQRTAEVDG